MRLSGTVHNAILTYAEDHADRLTSKQEITIASYLLEGIGLIQAREELFATGLRLTYDNDIGWTLEDMRDG